MQLKEESTAAKYNPSVSILNHLLHPYPGQAGPHSTAASLNVRKLWKRELQSAERKGERMKRAKEDKGREGERGGGEGIHTFFKVAIS